jgi:hypothetical protein
MNLFKFRLLLIPKIGKEGYRPISIEEPILQVVHKILLKYHLPTNFHKDQYAYKSDAYLKACIDAWDMAKRSYVMTLDIKNAFGTVPFTSILNGLMKLKLSSTK